MNGTEGAVHRSLGRDAHCAVGRTPGPDRSLVIAVAPASAQPDLSVSCVILFGYLERRLRQ